jgi:integrase
MTSGVTADGARVELTDAIIRAAVCPEGRAQTYLRDAVQPGLAVRLRPSGAKTFVLEHTRPGMKGTARTTIGPFPRLKVQAARKQARILAGQHAGGADLIAERRAAKRAARATAATLGALIAEGGEYETYLIGRSVVNWKTALSALRRNLAPDHKSTDLHHLTRRDVTNAMDKIEKTGKRGAAADLRKHAYSFFEWAVGRGFTSHNVLAGMRLPKQTRAERLNRKAKGRALTDAEIRKVWDAAGQQGAFGLLARLCLLGGPRRSEPTMIEWGRNVMVDGITFDAHWTKMGLHHDVPRTHLVDEVLDDAKRFRRATSDYVFPSSKTGERISGFTKQLDRLIEEAGTAKWTMHDLRRSLRTIMSKCGFDNDIQRLCVGQKPKGIDAVYNLDERWVIRKLAFEHAHAYIAALIAGEATSNVVRLARANNPQNKLKAELLDRLREHHTAAEK